MGAAGQGSERLDQRLVELGLVATRSQARQRILAGEVELDGQVVRRPAARAAAGAPVRLCAAARYVSRGGLKLAGALARLRVAVAGLRCIDAGAGTGGFTDCLLQGGARSVLAFDVGHGQLAAPLRADPRVRSLEGVHLRDFALAADEPAADLAVADLSFISLEKVWPRLAALVRPGGWLLVLIKPQFEVGRGALGRTGVVADPQLRAQALVAALAGGRAAGLRLLGACDSPLPGMHGNRELFALYARPQPPPAELCGPAGRDYNGGSSWGDSSR